MLFCVGVCACASVLCIKYNVTIALPIKFHFSLICTLEFHYILWVLTEKKRDWHEQTIRRKKLTDRPTSQPNGMKAYKQQQQQETALQKVQLHSHNRDRTKSLYNSAKLCTGVFHLLLSSSALNMCVHWTYACISTSCMLSTIHNALQFVVYVNNL